MTTGMSAGSIFYEVEADTSKLLSTTKPADASLDKLNKTFNRTDKAANQATFQMTKTAAAVKGLGRESQTASNALSGFKKALGGWLTLQGVRALIDMAEGYGEMSERVRMASASAAEYDMVQQRLLANANSTYRSLSESSEVYIRTADSLRAMGYSTEGALDAVDSLSYLFVTNATSAQRADGAISAFTKALNKGKVEADGWETLMAAVPSIVNDIATATGKSAEEIRKLGVSGDLTANMITEGLVNSLEKNRDAAAKMATNLKDAFRSFSNNLSVFLGEANNASGATGVLSSAIITLGENIDTIAKLLASAGAGAMAVYIANLLKAAVANAKTRVEALQNAQAQARLAAANAAAAASARATAAATTVQASASNAGAAAASRETVALGALATAKRAVTTAGAALLGVLGGPVGIVALVATAATGIKLFGDNARGAVPDVNSLTAAIDQLGAAQLKLRQQQASEALETTQRRITELSGEVRMLEKDFGDLSASPGVDDKGLENVRKTLVEARADLADSEEKARDFVQALQKINQEMDKRSGGGSPASAKPDGTAGDPEVQKRLQGMRDELELAKLTGAARARLQAIQKLGTAATAEERAEAEKLATQIYESNSAQKSWTTSTKESASASKENQKIIREMAEALAQAGLSGKELAEAEALSRLNKFATPDDVAQVKALADAMWELKQAKLDQQTIASVDPVAAETERYEEQIKAFQDMLDRKRISQEEFDAYMVALKTGHDETMGKLYADNWQLSQELETARYETQLEALTEALANEELTYAEYYARLKELQAEHANKSQELEKAKQASMLKASADGFGAILGVMQSFGASQNSLFKALFAAHKAFVLAQAVLDSNGAIQKAWNSAPFPANLPAVAITTAQTLGIVGAIQGTSMGGGKQYGGGVAPDTMYRINETGAPEVLNLANGQQYLLPNQRGEVVSNRDATASVSSSSSRQNTAVTPTKIMQVNLQGEIFSSKTVRNLITLINEEMSDGCRLNITY